MPRLSDRFPALASRDFNLFLSGQLVSVIGTWMQNTAQPYLAYRISGRPLDLGLIGFAATLPTLLLALPAGVLVERWDKRKTVIVLQAAMAIQAFGLAALTYLGHIQIWHITVMAFLFGTASAIEITARQAMLIELAGREALPSAIALQTTAFNTGRVIGPLCAAWVITSLGGEGTAFLLNGFSFLFVVAGLSIARTRYRVEKGTAEKNGVAAEFREGMNYIRDDAVVRTIILMSVLVGFFGFPLMQQIPALARTVLKSANDTEAIVATRTSALYAAQGAGALIAAFMAAYFSSSKKGIMLTLGQIAFIVPLIVLGLLANHSAMFILLIFIGWGIVTQLVTMNTMIQIKVPNGLRGRVFSAYLWAIQGVAPFGSVVIGWLAQSWGVQSAALAGGAICLVGISVLHGLTPRVRQSAN